MYCVLRNYIISIIPQNHPILLRYELMPPKMNSGPTVPWSDTDPGLLAPEPVTVLNNFSSTENLGYKEKMQMSMSLHKSGSLQISLNTDCKIK